MANKTHFVADYLQERGAQADPALVRFFADLDAFHAQPLPRRRTGPAAWTLLPDTPPPSIAQRGQQGLRQAVIQLAPLVRTGGRIATGAGVLGVFLAVLLSLFTRAPGSGTALTMPWPTDAARSHYAQLGLQEVAQETAQHPLATPPEYRGVGYMMLSTAEQYLQRSDLMPGTTDHVITVVLARGGPIHTDPPLDAHGQLVYPYVVVLYDFPTMPQVAQPAWTFEMSAATLQAFLHTLAGPPILDTPVGWSR